MKTPPPPDTTECASLTVVGFCMPLRGHLNRLLPLIAGLSRNGHTVHVFTHASFAGDVARAGGRFVDLFSNYPIASADDTSRPFACRYVSFAGYYIERVLEDTRQYSPALILYDSYAVIGHAIGSLLRLPHVSVCAGHNRIGARAIAARRKMGEVISRSCAHAVSNLRALGLRQATPYYYLSALSPYLNIYCEPPIFLRKRERSAYQPLAFFGSLGEERDDGARDLVGARGFPRSHSSKLRVYIAFGTVIWFHHAHEALEVLKTLSSTLATLDWVTAVISLGGWTPPAESMRLLSQHNVRVETYVDQWSILKEADVFITHHGLNSTHEAIYHRVPMISYPFAADQPALARRCQEFGLAVPLAQRKRQGLTPDEVVSSLQRVLATRKRFEAHLRRARQWELRIIEDRPKVLRRIAALATSARPRPLTSRAITATLCRP